MNYPLRYFDDFKEGDRVISAAATLTREECLAFAAAYDPQPFHLDGEAAAHSLFRRLSASGWQTTGIAMRLFVTSGFMRGPGVIGTGIDALRWHVPVYPGDALQLQGEVLELIPDARGKPRGLMRIRLELRNQDGAIVLSYIANLTVSCRPVV